MSKSNKQPKKYRSWKTYSPAAESAKKYKQDPAGGAKNTHPDDHLFDEHLNRVIRSSQPVRFETDPKNNKKK